MRFPNTESKIYSLGAEDDPQSPQQSELPRAAGHFNFRTTANLAERGRAGQHGACGTVEAGHHFFGDREKSWRSLSA